MVEVWLPDYFRPEYDTLDESLADASLRWVKLGDLVAQYSAAVSSTSETNLRWRAQATTTSLEIREPLASGHASTTDVVLPDNAIIVRLGGASLIQVVDLPPVLRQMVKTHFSLNGELSHGIVS